MMRSSVREHSALVGEIDDDFKATKNIAESEQRLQEARAEFELWLSSGKTLELPKTQEHPGKHGTF